MKEKGEKKIQSTKFAIILLECLIVIASIIGLYLVLTPKDRVKDTTYSYSKLEEIREYEIEGEYITRVRPLTEYNRFKETAENTLNKNEEEITYTIKVYSDTNKTQEVTEGYIKSGMLLEGIQNVETEEEIEEGTESETTNETVTYTISVIGDFTKDADINVTELTKIIKGIVGLNNWIFTEEEKLIADFNGDKEINVVDIEECINYIVYGRLTLENGMKLKATDEYGITWNYTYLDGTATNVHYESGELPEVLNIPSRLDGYPVVKLYNSSEEANIFAKAEEAYEDIERTVRERRTFEEGGVFSNLKIKTINIPNSVKKIGNNAFELCTNATNIKIPDSVIGIGEFAFFGCTNLTSITIPDGIEGIGANTFYACNNLAEIEIPDSVISVREEAFKETSWYNNQPDGVVYAGKVAYEYKGTMPENTVIEIKEGTKTMVSGLFSDCTGLLSIKIPNSITTIEQDTFYKCTSLSQVILPNTLTSIGTQSFYRCTGLTSIEIPNSVTSIGSGAFKECTSLTSIEIPDSVTSIAPDAFNGCTGLINIEIPDSVTSIGLNAFYRTAWYNNQPDGVVYAGKVVYKYKGTMPEDAVIEIRKGTKGIGDSAFDGCTGLTRIEIPDSVTSIEDRAFYGCSSLIEIVIPDNVTSIGSGAFYRCTELANVIVGNSVISIGSHTFDGCTGLTSIEIPDSVTSIAPDAFNGCTGLINIEIPDSVTSIGSNAFYRTTWYNNQPDGVVYVGNVVYNYKGTMPEDTVIEIKEGTKSIGDSAFNGCTGLINIEIPDSVTSIGYRVFENCINLSNIIIWRNVDKLGYRTFGGWNEEQTVNVEADEMPEGWDKGWSEGCNAKIVYGYTGE